MLVYIKLRLSDPSTAIIVLAERNPAAHLVEFDLTTVNRSPSKGRTYKAAINAVGGSGNGMEETARS